MNNIYRSFQSLIKNYEIHMHNDKSTSIHFINGDRPLGETEKILYFLLNYVNNKTTSPDVKVENFVLGKEKFNNFWNGLEGAPSPSRAMSDMFWMNLPWQDMKKDLGEINILDIGCGKGNYCKKLYDWSSESLSSYEGMDQYASPNWKELVNWGTDKEINVAFSQIDIDMCINDLHTYIPEGTNFFMSQSSLEHIKNDLEVFRQLKKYILKNKNNCIQIHLFPASASLDLYLLHGFRQYGNFALKKITDLFDDFCSIEIFKMCGEASNKLHFDYITKPIYLDNTVDRREVDPDKYQKLLRESLLIDMESNISNPAFWALKIVYEKDGQHRREEK